MATVIYINPAAFGPGGRFEAYANMPSKVRVEFGQSDTNYNMNGAGLGIVYSNARLNREAARAGIVVTTSPITIDNDQVDPWSQFNKNALAALVDQGLVIVERPAGAAVTSTTIRGW